MTPAPTTQRKWSTKEIRDLILHKTKKRAQWFQIQAAQALYQGKDIVACAPTGAGKTLSFWIPLLMAIKDGINVMVIVVTPLNLLGKQNVESLGKMGLTGVAVDHESANAKTFKVNS